MYWDWASNMRKWAYNSWIRICTDGSSTIPCNLSAEELWDDGTGSYSVVPYTGRYARPLEVTGPPYTGGTVAAADIGAGVTTYWWAYLYDSAPYIDWDGYYQVCFDFTITGGAAGGGDLFCDDVCAESFEGSFGTPTPTPTETATPLPSSTPTWPPTNTPIGGAPTNTPPSHAR